jgi:hypothetical protein
VARRATAWLSLLAVLAPVLASAQLLRNVLPLGNPATSATPASGAPGDSNPERHARPLKAWIDDEVLTKHKRDWKRTDADKPLPWIAPGQRVEAWLHIDHYDDYGDRKEIRWHVGTRLAYPRYVFDYAISDGLLRDPVSLPWPHSGETMQRPDEDGTRSLIVSPYRLQLVAVQPLIVVLLPYKEAPKPEHAWNKPREKLSSADDAIDHDDIRYSSEFPARDGTLWFSPDARIAVHPLAFDDKNAARIEAGDAHLNCERREGVIRCTRVATDAKPGEAKPAAAKPAETKPADAKPADAKKSGP